MFQNHPNNGFPYVEIPPNLRHSVSASSFRFTSFAFQHRSHWESRCPWIFNLPLAAKLLGLFLKASLRHSLWHQPSSQPLLWRPPQRKPWVRPPLRAPSHSVRHSVEALRHLPPQKQVLGGEGAGGLSWPLPVAWKYQLKAENFMHAGTHFITFWHKGVKGGGVSPPPEQLDQHCSWSLFTLLVT